MSIKKSQAFSAGTSRSIFPSRIIAKFLPEQIQARSYVRKIGLTRAAPALPSQLNLKLDTVVGCGSLP
jgi:hypothetical protein